MSEEEVRSDVAEAIGGWTAGLMISFGVVLRELDRRGVLPLSEVRAGIAALPSAQVADVEDDPDHIGRALLEILKMIDRIGRGEL